NECVRQHSSPRESITTTRWFSERFAQSFLYFESVYQHQSIIVRDIFVSEGMANIKGYVFDHWVVEPQDHTEAKEKMEQAIRTGVQSIRV
ncbi:MAG: hypothetical protein RJQ14_08705, partial [Marinoscillum sp.]